MRPGLVKAVRPVKLKSGKMGKRSMWVRSSQPHPSSPKPKIAKPTSLPDKTRRDDAQRKKNEGLGKTQRSDTLKAHDATRRDRIEQYKGKIQTIKGGPTPNNTGHGKTQRQKSNALASAHGRKISQEQLDRKQKWEQDELKKQKASHEQASKLQQEVKDKPKLLTRFMNALKRLGGGAKKAVQATGGALKKAHGAVKKAGQAVKDKYESYNVSELASEKDKFDEERKREDKNAPHARYSMRRGKAKY